MQTNIPDVSVNNREIPAGKVLLAEYGQIPSDALRPQRSVLDVKTGWGRAEVRLEAVTAGWAIAGSMLRWDNGHYGVFWEIGGSRHGSRYRSFDDALAHFNRIPTELH